MAVSIVEARLYVYDFHAMLPFDHHGQVDPMLTRRQPKHEAQQNTRTDHLLILLGDAELEIPPKQDMLSLVV